MIIEKIGLTVPTEHHHERTDIFLTHSLEYDLSRSYIQKLIRFGNITVNGKKIKQNYRVKSDDVIQIDIPEPDEPTLQAENIPIEIIYEDNSIAIINKPPGMVVHPGPGNWNKTLVNALLYHLKNLSSIGGTIRPGIVHRLDKDTSGLMIIAKNDESHRFISEEFMKRRVTKKYCAIVVEKPKREYELIDRPIGRHPKYRHKMAIIPEGRDSVTEYYLIKIWNTNNGIYSLLEILPHTGRTHQIRVHLSSNGNPIVGDPIYSKKWKQHRVPYLLLSSTYLELTHPKTGKSLNFAIPLPEHIVKFVKRIEIQASGNAS